MDIGIPSHTASCPYSISAAVFPMEYMMRQSVLSDAAAETADETAIPVSYTHLKRAYTFIDLRSQEFIGVSKFSPF